MGYTALAETGLVEGALVRATGPGRDGAGLTGPHAVRAKNVSAETSGPSSEPVDPLDSTHTFHL
jgi:hypothetical protein